MWGKKKDDETKANPVPVSNSSETPDENGGDVGNSVPSDTDAASTEGQKDDVVNQGNQPDPNATIEAEENRVDVSAAPAVGNTEAVADSTPIPNEEEMRNIQAREEERIAKEAEDRKAREEAEVQRSRQANAYGAPLGPITNMLLQSVGLDPVHTHKQALAATLTTLLDALANGKLATQNFVGGEHLTAFRAVVGKQVRFGVRRDNNTYIIRQITVGENEQHYRVNELEESDLPAVMLFLSFFIS